ncbi:MAG: PDZ domain-containing protein [candidate division KSB1 bacterium]|nr:PDZ domain-containing protein [candidate division KSB1 bacterium]MDZ7275962.1 PDZ domain-containing protein [candidate division KSB1 bacterium]MDZ7285756.1 PDZ domain-containing protein [candidate division KSB1 bacterium]MDZ7298788.1 PDZ domain-containing protein [candidate division KSB1 bacterium]MDZ7307922.1 PDZ domain-containing protein [candidate division KSB1 bacterium]
MFLTRWMLMTLSLVVSAAAAPTLRYTVDVTDRRHHFLDLTITIEDFAERVLEFAMPAWSPGRYVIYDFAKNVSQVRAADEHGNPLAVERLDKQTWRLHKGKARRCELRYRVFANTLSGTFSQANEEHVHLSGASVFMYAVNYKHLPIMLVMPPPADWQVATGLSRAAAANTYFAPNYDILIDCPVEMGNFQQREFELYGKKHFVVVHNDGRGQNLEPLVRDLQAIVRTAERILRRGLPYEQYWFLCHFAPHLTTGDGMEHLNTAQLIVTSELADMTANAADHNYERLLLLAAHEFFHTWNVKRIRPAGLGPFDYSREVYSRNLWIAEGLTSYYAPLILKRMGFYTEREFLARLAAEIAAFEQHPGARQESAETTSMLTWLFLRTPIPLDDTRVKQHFTSYYNHGAVLGMLLDLEIRQRSNNRRSLDDVLATLYDRFFVCPPESYYLQGKGYTAADFQQVVEEMAGVSLDDFFAAFVRGTQAVDYNRFLQHAGLQLKVLEHSRPADVGLAWQAGGELVVAEVTLGSVADQAGLERGDKILAVNQREAFAANWEDLFAELASGAPVKFLFERRGRLREAATTYRPGRGFTYEIVPLVSATSSARELKDKWLGAL